LGIVQGWYTGFWALLSFAMQMVLILATGYALAISPPISRFLDWLATRIGTPVAVYASSLSDLPRAFFTSMPDPLAADRKMI